MLASGLLTVRVKCPSRSVVVPLDVPLSRTAAPGTGSPVWSRTVPEIRTGSGSGSGEIMMFDFCISYFTFIGVNSFSHTSVIVAFVVSMLTVC